MTRLLYRLSRGACPAADRPWLDALFAELGAIQSSRARCVWLLGATGLLLDRYTRLLTAAASPASLLLAASALVFGWMALTEYEGLLPEDDWYGILAALFIISLISISVLNLRRYSRSLRP